MDDPTDSPEPARPAGPGRRRVLAYLLAAPTLAVGARVGLDAAGGESAEAAVPSLPQPEELFDLGDMQTLAAAPTSGLISVQVHTDGTASFAVPRAEVGQGMTTAVAMMIAEELDLPLEKVRVSLADARPELLMNQLTGGSNSMRSIYLPVRSAAAVARQRLVATAAQQWGVPESELTTADGVIKHGSGRSATYGSLAEAAASTRAVVAAAHLKSPSEFTVLGTPRNRIDARDIVTGRKKFGMDLRVPDAKPTMVRRPPTVNGTVVSVSNADAVKAMPGVTDVATLRHGVAVRGETFGQCIDALRALDVTWGPGTVDKESDDTVLAELRAAALPMTVPALLTKKVDAEFTFAFASNSPLEPDNAIADVRSDRAEIWASLKVPIVAQRDIADRLGLPQSAVTVHVVEGGGSFGRHLFHDVAAEAAEISQKMGKPVKLSWSRTDNFRQGRTHPMCVSRVRATYALGNVLSYEQRHTSSETDFGHGLGEMITSTAAKLPVAGNLTFAETIFQLTQSTPYNFGVTTQLLNEVPLKFNTGSMRNIYSPNVACARELIVDQLAGKMGKDPVAFRREFLKEERLRAVLDKAAEAGEWGRALPDGVAQGIALHTEYRGAVASLVEIDCRPETVNRKVRDGVTGPRVTRALMVVDAGFAINPRGLEAQMMGGLNDALAMALTSSLHIKDGIPLEGSWDNYFYTRQWNTPPDLRVIVMPSTGDKPSGAGELGVAPAFAAIACAYARATGTLPTSFPVNHATLSFDPLPLEPSTPQSPTDGLDRAF
ncbi:xanthine dehydrogenase family protein molybdopterin-binding subunit [Streptomyces antnestii]|uniref:Xanthine dehydrogenase family protein molybdopterin-binding subunit n=1 Tax=Streptomyces antnestii TaxID=2494256 RepID=A0A437PIV8_9ACTN|nr:molybdopterin cofactor-binding domain-containing protein [Streptomyces sp. San01]RVU22232.1 xanthine dehydrogenase family protein molybdopterin-binding subunit [Streptomyces sp. San01]